MTGNEDTDHKFKMALGKMKASPSEAGQLWTLNMKTQQQTEDTDEQYLKVALASARGNGSKR